ncbi:colicin I receptor precursor [bacterium BMS3Abin12]|nr:colicin I receptor precursor [bacterium BMS3Abin12]
MRLVSIMVFIALLSMVSRVHAEAPDESDLARAYGGAEFVTVATGARQPLARAPAVATVITARDIREIGATNLAQVLETVPGIHASVSGPGYNPIFMIRGIYSDFNPEVLMLVNGIPITNLFLGNRSQAWGGMPVEDISRIEVIRGPGSALYGADAFAGVINIVTKTADEIRGTRIGMRGGGFGTYGGWILHGGNYHDTKVAFALQARTTDGFHGTVDQDAQTALDRLFGTQASLAPGSVNTGGRRLDARLDLARGHWRFRTGYQGRFGYGTGAGGSFALDPVGSGGGHRFNADLTYHTLDLNPNWDLKARLSYFDVATKTDLVLFPPGAFGGTFSNGVIGNPDVFERQGRLDLSAFYTGFRRHRVRIGTGVFYGDMYKTRETKNFTIGPGGIPTPLGGLVDVSQSAPFIRPHHRTDAYVYLQDEWDFVRDWALTAGVRYDRYSDFGGTTNPRLALVWQARYDLTAKLLYGRAFRAPSFAEQYNINNPVALGNPNLKPETINTAELAFDYQPTPAFRAGVDIFHYRMSDIIRFVPEPAPATSATVQNSGSQTGNGLEAEFTWHATPAFTLRGNYAFQRSIDDRTGTDAGMAPEHQIYLRGDWRFIPGWSWDAQGNWVAGRRRVAGDNRPPVGPYLIVDTTLRHRVGHTGLHVAASIRNLFDRRAKEPSPAPGLIPDDLPLPGRSFYIEARYDF